MNTTIKIVTLLLLFLSASLSRAEFIYHGSATLTSDYLIRGLSQTLGNPSLQISAGAEHLGSGLYGGLWLANIDTSELLPDLGQSDGYEADVFVGLSRSINRDWHWDINLGRYTYLRDERMLDYDYSEITGSLGYQQLLRASVIYSPKSTDHTRQNTLLQGSRVAYEVGGEWPLSDGFAVNGGVGYNDLSQVSDVKHVYWGAGLVYRFNRFAANLSFIATDAEARERFIDGRADNRWVLSVTSVFGG
jgi:uncharacterized protein (TIGR02001 family)